MIEYAIVGGTLSALAMAFIGVKYPVRKDGVTLTKKYSLAEEIVEITRYKLASKDKRTKLVNESPLLNLFYGDNKII